MSTNTPNVRFNVIDDAIRPSSPIGGVVYVMGPTTRGPVGDPKDIITNTTQFRRIFGKELPDNDFPKLCNDLLQGGVSLRVNRIAHYTDPTNPNTLTATRAVSEEVTNANGDELFTLRSKYEGADYNNLKIVISEASNLDANHFNLSIIHSEDFIVSETFENLIIDGTPTALESNYLEALKISRYIEVDEYEDLSSLTAPVRPENGIFEFTGGSNGAAIVDADYIGDKAAGLGFYAFDDYEEAYIISTLNRGGVAIDIAGDTFQKTRKDLVFFATLNPNIKTEAAYIAYRNSVSQINDDGTAFFGSALIQGANNDEYPSVTEAIILANRVHQRNDLGYHRSFAGDTFGVTTNVAGVSKNYGAPARFDELNNIVKRQINIFINRRGLTFLNTALTSVTRETPLKFLSVKFFILHLKRRLEPIFRGVIDLPSDFTTLGILGNNVNSEMGIWVTRRAISSFNYFGDQDANSFDALQINDPDDLQNGKIKARLSLTPIGPVQEIELDIVISRAGVEINVV